MRVQSRSVAVLALCLLACSQPLRAAEFSPDGCEYSVSFPSKPSIYSHQKMTADGALIPLHGAQLVVSGGAGQMRAECGPTYDADLTQFNERNFTHYMAEIARDLGLSRPAFEFEVTRLGRRGTLTGTKESERGRITVRVINLVGESSILTIYLMAFSDHFQTPEMTPFVRSIEKR